MSVAIIGGGIIGFSCAYYLRERDVDVTVLEKGSIGGGSTERANGGIRAQFSTPVHIELSRESIDVWETFEEDFGTDIAYRQHGYMYLARSEETLDVFRENVATQNDLGVPSEIITPEEAAERCPELHTEEFVGASFCGIDGYADSHLGLQGFAAAAREAGAAVRTNTPVTDVLSEGGRVVGVRTPDGTVEADHVVNAAGPWARQVAAMAGLDIPVAPKRRQIVIVVPEVPIEESVPMVGDVEPGVIFRPEREGNALISGGNRGRPDPDADPDNYSTDFETDWAVNAIELSGDAAGYFGPDTEIKRGWAGLYAVTPDHHPIVEETVPGFVNAVGFSGHGFMQSPATGQCVAEIVTEGEASTVDVTPLAADRFERGEELHEAMSSF